MVSNTLIRRLACGAGLALALVGPARPQAGDEALALHVLNRLSFGPVPGDLARVQEIGVDRYIDEQLHPESLPLPGQLQAQLDSLGSLRASQRELLGEFRQATQADKRGDAGGKAERREIFQRLALEAGAGRLLNALQSPRQLQEVMVDFWFNHFNVFGGKGLDRVLVQSYEREAIRPHVLGRFRDLLGATAHHPAMLFYLDNWVSSAPGSLPGRAAPGAPAAATGLNENYARELMELHTLGVDGGYSQSDVSELARMLTGWTFRPRGRGDGSLFSFDPLRHDSGPKTWLGRPVTARGEAEGEWALDVLAAHPATAQHIARELAQAFVADDPPAALVERLARRFHDSDGDIRAVLAALFASAEFRDLRFLGRKFKTPYRYVLSSLRAADLPVRDVRPLLVTLTRLGMPLHGCPTPDGWRNTEAAWLNPDAMTRRIDFATALAAGRLALAPEADGAAASARSSASGAGTGPRFDTAGPGATADAEALLATLGPGIGSRTRQAVRLADPGLRAALLLGSPDFMHH